MVSMTVLLGELRQLNINCKDIMSNKTKTAYNSGAIQMDSIGNNEQTVQFQFSKAFKHKIK